MFLYQIYHVNKRLSLLFGRNPCCDICGLSLAWTFDYRFSWVTHQRLFVRVLVLRNSYYNLGHPFAKAGVRVCVCMSVCMYVCMHAYIHTNIYTLTECRCL